MKKTLFSSFLIAFYLQSCCYPDDYEDVEPYSSYQAIYMSRSQLDSAIQLKSPQNIDETGKIYVYNDFLFVGDKRKGFHVFDNTDQSNPQKINFLNIPGCTDLAIRNDYLYVNQGTDLLTLSYDFQNETLEMLKRNKNTFAPISSPDGFTPTTKVDSVAIDWIVNN